MKMNKLVIITLFLMLSAGSLTWAQEEGLGLGILLGDPTGFSLKLWLSESSSLNAGLAYSFSVTPNFHIHADYILHFKNIFPEPVERLDAYAGIGGKCYFETNSISIGVRIPLGLVWYFKEIPMDAFLEIVPAMDIFAETRFSPNGGIGVHWFL